MLFPKWCVPVLAAFVCAAATIDASAADDPRTQYELRSAQGYVALFQRLDRDGDGIVSRAEAQGDLNFQPRFDDMDVNRDNFVTAAELSQWIERSHGVRVSFGAAAGQSPAGAPANAQ